MLSDLTTSTKFTILRPPLQIGPTIVFRLTLSGLKFQMKEKIFLLTSFTNSTGTFNTEQLWTSLARAKFLTMAILPRIVKCLLDQMFRTFLSLARRSSKLILFPARTL